MYQFLIKSRSINLLQHTHLKSIRRIISASSTSILSKNSIQQTIDQRDLHSANFSRNPVFIPSPSFNNSLSFLSQIRYFHKTRYLCEENSNSNKNNNDNSSSSGGGDGDDNKNREPNDEIKDANSQTLPLPSLVALAPIQIPENFPKVPLVAISRNPLFPNFIKMLEVCYHEKKKLNFIVMSVLILSFLL